MMSRAGSRATIGAMHTGASFLSYAMMRAAADGSQRAAEFRAEAEAHAIGRAYYVKRVRQRRAEALEKAAAAKARLLANRARLHG